MHIAQTEMCKSEECITNYLGLAITLHANVWHKSACSVKVVYIPDVMLNKPCAFMLPLCVALTCRSGLHIGEGFVQLGDTCPDLTELFLEVSLCIGPGGTHTSHTSHATSKHLQVQPQLLNTLAHLSRGTTLQ